jgi:hypothetical protein
MTPGLQQQERERANSLEELARLRKDAAAEIDRLIGFLDASDSYVQTELEEECEDEGAACEDEGAGDGDEEPSLGFLEWHPTPTGYVAGVLTDHHGNQEHITAGLGDNLEDEHDGCEPNHDEEEDRADDEPLLGWTVDGVIGNTGHGREDLELNWMPP